MDTALKVYKVAYERALYLVRMAFGLTDHRQRGMRSDWADNFKKFMRWKQTDGILRLDSKDALIVLRHECYLKAEYFQQESISELYRSAVVLLMSAVDAYFHAKILSYVNSVAKIKPSEHLLNLRIQLRQVLPDVGIKKKSECSVRRLLEDNLSRASLQSPKEIAAALNYLGIDDFWNKLSKKMKKSKLDIVKPLEAVVKRRNQIVHEGDTRTRGKHAAKPREMRHKIVYDWCTSVNVIVHASDDLIEEELKKKKG